MTYERERVPGTGVLFTNHKKSKDGHPDWQGEYKAKRDIKEGELVKLSAWTKQSARGPLISIKDDDWRPDPNYRQNRQPTPSRSLDDLDEDVPF